jgi:hypothetical protein
MHAHNELHNAKKCDPYRIAISITTFGRAIEALDEPLILIKVLDIAIKADFASKTAQTNCARAETVELRVAVAQLHHHSSGKLIGTKSRDRMTVMMLAHRD